MTQELLDQYRDLKAEILSLERKIKKLDSQKSEKVADTVIGSTPGRDDPHVITIFGYPDGGKIQKRIKRLEAILTNRFYRLLDLQIEIEEYIDMVEDSQVRSIIEWRYIDGCSWRIIARKMGHPSSDEQYPRKILSRYFERVEI